MDSRLVAGGREPALNCSDVVSDQWSDVRVDSGRTCPPILPDLWSDVTRKGNGELRIGLQSNLSHTALMCWVAVGMQETNGDRLDSLAAELGNGCHHCFLIKFFDDVSKIVETLWDAVTPSTWNQWSGFVGLQVVQFVSDLPADLQKVSETKRYQQTRRR